MSGSNGDRPLPHNLEAERSVLGAVLLDSEGGRSALSAAIRHVSAVDFFLPQHARIFVAMFDLVDAAVPIDTVTLLELLARKGELEAAGGAAYLSQLGDGLPRVTNVEHYARIVRENAELRTLIYSASAIQDQAFARANPAEIIGRATKALSEIQAGAPSGLFDTWEEFKNERPLRSLIKNFVQAQVCNVVGGLSGDGKTLILFSVTKALLTGKPLFGHFEVLEPLDRVIYLIPESARAPFFHRSKLFALEKYIANGRLLVRTLTKGPRIDLNEPRLLCVVKGAAVIIDTAARFGKGNENDAGDVAQGLAKDIFGLLGAGAATVICAHHSPKGFEKETYITLENVLRGSGDFGAFIGAGFGIRQIDEGKNIIHLQDIKARDTEPLPPFQIIGRPYIDEEGDFRIHIKPGECRGLADYLDLSERNRRGGAPQAARDAKAANMELLRGWLREDPSATSEALAARYAELDIEISPVTVRKYRARLEK